MSHFALGIDTGGTFTDGVIFDLERNTIVSKTKVITTRYDLLLAVSNCLDNLLDDLEAKKLRAGVLSHLKMCCLSTTLATNATVEGQGADVGLIVIGTEIEEPLPTGHRIGIRGGCDIKGREKETVDLEAAGVFIKEMSSKVESFAVSGYMSVRNPEQEQRVASLIRDETGYPVVCGHYLSGDLGVYERTVTAVLNARLIPLVAQLIDAVRKSLDTKRIKAPLRIVKGDGSLISEQTALERPIETILSGPAASLIGARTLSGIEDGVVVDIGGTTTDVAVVKKGRPILKDEGAKIGGWFTRVKAADITTIGLGGDSLIQISRKGVLSIGPQKVFPLCWSVSENPYLLGELEEAAASAFSPMDAQPTCILFISRLPDAALLQKSEQDLLELLQSGPRTLFAASRILKKDHNLLPWKRLVNLGAIHRGNLTPTDILHVNGVMSRWDARAAELGTELLVKRYSGGTGEFIDDVMQRIGHRLFSLLIEKAFPAAEASKDPLSDDYVGRLFYRMYAGTGDDIRFSAELGFPVVGVGAPVEAYLPDPVRRLNTECILTDDADVANAVGTVNGKVVERVKIVVKPCETGGYFVYTPEERYFDTDFEKALNYAEETGRAAACRRAEESGGSAIQVEIEREDRYLPLGSQTEDDSGKLFVESIIEISAVGLPWHK